MAAWKETLLQVLGENGQILVDAIPELELIIGKQLEVASLGVLENQNRFERLLQRFIGAFARSEHPLVLFLDDLQWADFASLKLIQTLVGDRDTQSLLIIGAYRDNEVDATHPLVQTIEKLDNSGATVHRAIVRALQKSHIIDLLQDTLTNGEERQSVPSLGELIFQKTQGNPFFIVQLLKSLYAKNLISYDFSRNQWQWSLEQIQAIGIQDNNVVELIANNITKLSEPTQQVLKLAACLGNQFSLEFLAVVNNDSTIRTADRLWEAMQAGLILPIGDAYKVPLLLRQEESFSIDKLKVDYKFLHDRVQQAAYWLIPEAERKFTHLRIGNLLLKKTDLATQEKNIFTIVNQLNFGLDLLTSQSAKNKLAKLNLIAGKKAKLSAAYDTRKNYLDLALNLLAVDSWTNDWELTFELYREAIEAEYVNGNFDRAQSLAEIALQEAKTLLERVEIYEVQIQAYIAQNQMQVAIETGLQVLVILGINLAQEPPPELTIEQLANLPAMGDRDKLAAIRILLGILSPAYIIQPTFLLPINWTAIRLFIEFGNAPQAPYIYVVYGVLLLSFMADIEGGYEFGKLGMSLLDRFDSREIKTKVIQLFNGFIRSWKEPLRATVEPCLDAVQMGLDNGDIENASYAAINYCTYQFMAGVPLPSVDRAYTSQLGLMEKTKQEYAIILLKIWRQLTLNLSSDRAKTFMLDGEAFREAEMLPILAQSNNQTWLFYFHVAKLILAYFLKNLDLALFHAKEAEKYQEAAAGLITVAQYNFYYSLTAIARYERSDRQLQDELLERVNINQEKMKVWADFAPSNFQHKYDLVAAEIARALGEKWQAMELYDRAIAGAKRQQYLQEEALSYELAAEFYGAYGKDKIARTYLMEAYYQYERWGAVAKIQDLKTKYSQLLGASFESKIQTIDRKSFLDTKIEPGATVTLQMRELDIYSILKASQAISEELILDRLLDRLMKILLENTGAQTGFIILSNEDKLTIEIAGSLARQGITLVQSIPLHLSQQVPVAAIEYAARTQKLLVSDDDNTASLLENDAYIQRIQPKSMLCAPIIKQKRLLGVVYLENNLVKGVFKRDRRDIVELLCSQAAISLENARLYQKLQQSQARERAEQQIRKALAKEKELTELKARFISMASHEFRTPLTTILGSTELLKYYSHKWSEEKKHTHFDRIESNVKHMTYLLDSVLLLGKADAGKLECVPTPMDLVEFCHTFVEEIRLGTNAKQTITFSFRGQSREAQIDERLLRHILSNLLTNAIKYSAPDSTVDFQLQFDPGEVIFLIRDRGIGIPTEDLQQLFSSFHRARNVGKIPGSGLGLAIVKRSVDLHDGKIAVNSEVGVGTTVTVTIPST